jgi:methylenetetrahydrofolate reductase (NADPH)
MSTHPEPMDAGREMRLALIANLKYEVVPMNSADAAISALPPASTVSVTCSPVKGIATTMELTDRIRSLGHTAVPHIAARMIEGPGHVRQIAHWLRSEAVDHLFLVGGDAESPAGPYNDASGFLHDLLAAGPELVSVGVTSYPDGHPAIDRDTLRAALHHKQQTLAEAGVAGYTSTQMCFDPERIERWLTEERQAGLTLPIHLGVAGVIDRRKLMTMGVRLGVGTSLRYLKKNRAAIGRLMTSPRFDPNTILEPLESSLTTLGIEGVHCFTFNQIASTVAWQRTTLTGQ